MPHKGIYKRQNSPPHWDFDKSVQAITFRLGDSLPATVIESWKRELEHPLQDPDTKVSQKAQADLHRLISQYEDAGHGSCLLANSHVAQIMQAAFISDHGITYKLIEWTSCPITSTSSFAC